MNTCGKRKKAVKPKRALRTKEAAAITQAENEPFQTVNETAYSETDPELPSKELRIFDRAKSAIFNAAVSRLDVSLISRAAAAALAVIIIMSTTFSSTLLYLLSTPLGIFLSGGNMKNDDGNMSVSEAVQRINGEFQRKITQIEEECPDAGYIIKTGNRAPWTEVLPVYAAKKMNSNYVNRNGAFSSLDEEDFEELESLFDIMTSLEYSLTERDYVRKTDVTENDRLTVEEEDEHGMVLEIIIRSRSAEETAEILGFDEEQTEILRELKSERFASAWREILYGAGGGDIVEVALSQVGNVGGEEYWSWYGYESRVEWCACFVSWCADACGLIDGVRFPKFDNCRVGSDFFARAGGFKERGYEPEEGDIIFFDWEGDGISDHVGIVEKAEGGFVFTVEGNSGDMCVRKSYEISSPLIYGYGIYRAG